MRSIKQALTLLPTSLSHTTSSSCSSAAPPLQAFSRGLLTPSFTQQPNPTVEATKPPQAPWLSQHQHSTAAQPLFARGRSEAGEFFPMGGFYTSGQEKIERERAK